MAQQTATEKDMFLQTFERESKITLKILKALPASQAEYRPHPKSRSARELAWVFTMEQAVLDMALNGKVDFSGPAPPPPANYNDVISAFEQASKATIDKISKATDDTLSRTVQFPVGPGKMGDFRAMDVLWTTVMDQVHHRGQFSVYLRLAGGNVPSIYGPSADETWM